jgi:hypothetical protein
VSDNDEQASRPKRKHRRVATRGVTAVVTAGGESTSYVVANLSLGGALVLGGIPPARDLTLDIELKLKGERALSVRGHVAHARPEGIGIAFDPLSQDDTAAMATFITAVDAQNLMPPPLPAKSARNLDELPPPAPRTDDAFFDAHDPRPPRTASPDDREQYLRTLVKNRDETIKKGRAAYSSLLSEADQLRSLANRLKGQLEAAQRQASMNELALATARKAQEKQLEATLAERATGAEQLEAEQRRTLEAIAMVSSLEAQLRRRELDVSHAKDEAELARREATASALEASSARRAREELLTANRKAMESQASLTKERNARVSAEKQISEAQAAELAAHQENERLLAEVQKMKQKLVAAEEALEKAAARKAAGAAAPAHKPGRLPAAKFRPG